MLHDLLPLESEAPRCSDFARSIQLLPPGSGLHLQRAVLVSVPTPWPKPALGHDLLAAAAPFINKSEVKSRLFAMEPTSSNVDLEVYERTPSGAMRYQWQIEATGHDTAQHIASAVEAIAGTPVGGLAELDMNSATMQSSGLSPDTFLICTQGTHDFCCGDTGVRYADQITNERPSCEVRRVSHTGGHRFSPTMLAFPEGRMWAFADLQLADRILNGSVTAEDYRCRSRGWWGAKVGPAQVAETAVRSELAATGDAPASDLTLELVADEPDLKTFHVRVASQQWRVEVTVGRQVPSIACESPGGLPAKPGREFSWTMQYQGEA